MLELDDAPQTARPVEVDSDQIETLIENNECYTAWEIANMLKIPKSIKLLVKMKNMSFILQEKLNKLCGQPNFPSIHFSPFPWPLPEFKSLSSLAWTGQHYFHSFMAQRPLPTTATVTLNCQFYA